MSENKAVKLLVAEDDPMVRSLYEELFRGAGMQVRVTHDGSHAATMLRTEAFDLAILDVKLPNMNGLQVAAIARSSKLNKALPILIVSGAIDATVEARAKELKGLTVLPKPFDPERLVALVKEFGSPAKKPSAYDARIVNAVLAATAEVFEFYCGKSQVCYDKPGVRKTGNAAQSGFASLIEIKGTSFAGSLALVAPRELAVHLGKLVLQNEAIQFDDVMTADVMGELSNQVCGRLKIAFAGLGVKSVIGLPAVMHGSSFTLTHKVDAPAIVVPLKVGERACAVELCLVEQKGFVIDEAKAEQSATGVLMFE